MEGEGQDQERTDGWSRVSGLVRRKGVEFRGAGDSP